MLGQVLGENKEHKLPCQVDSLKVDEAQQADLATPAIPKSFLLIPCLHEDGITTPAIKLIHTVCGSGIVLKNLTSNIARQMSKTN